MPDSMVTSMFSAFDKKQIVQHGLPSPAYTDKYFFEQEAKHLFANSWTFVGFAHDLQKVGDIIPIEVAGQPFFIVRSSKNSIRSFHNICSHRNLKLVDKSHNCKRLITCPYHRWSYSLDGELQATRGDETLRSYVKGDTFGELAMLDGGARVVTVIATKESTLAAIAHDDFHDM